MIRRGEPRDNLASQLTHEALGFAGVDSCVNYRKSIARGEAEDDVRRR